MLLGMVSATSVRDVKTLNIPNNFPLPSRYQFGRLLFVLCFGRNVSFETRSIGYLCAETNAYPRLA